MAQTSTLLVTPALIQKLLLSSAAVNVHKQQIPFTTCLPNSADVYEAIIYTVMRRVCAEQNDI